MKSRSGIIAINAVLVAIMACTLGQAPGPSEQDLAATITSQALTLQAPSLTPAPPTATLPPAATDTPNVPQVTVSSTTNCRSGPAIYYDHLWTMEPNQIAEVVGKHTPSGYWIIKYPGGTCWLWGQYATVSGNINALPEYPQPATPTPSKPAAPTNFKVEYTCTLQMNPIILNQVHVEMSWTDVATNEEGYRIFRNGDPLATLGANESSFSDDTTMVGLIIIGTDPPQITYAIEAFNGAGKSEKKSRSISCFD